MLYIVPIHFHIYSVCAMGKFSTNISKIILYVFCQLSSVPSFFLGPKMREEQKDHGRDKRLAFFFRKRKLSMVRLLPFKFVYSSNTLRLKVKVVVYHLKRTIFFLFFFVLFWIVLLLFTWFSDQFDALRYKQHNIEMWACGGCVLLHGNRVWGVHK